MSEIHTKPAFLRRYCSTRCALILGLLTCSVACQSGNIRVLSQSNDNTSAFGNPSSITPENTGATTLGGTITFKNIGAAGYWARRLNITSADPSCNIESDVVNLGGAGGNVFCCRAKHEVDDVALSPFHEQMAFVLRGPMQVKQMVVYQPTDSANTWQRVSYWDSQSQTATNLKFTGPNDNPNFSGWIGDSCQWYAMTPKPFLCGAQSDPYCPDSGPDLHYQGWDESKLVVFLMAMHAATDTRLAPYSCVSNAEPINAPWIGFSASELIRDGMGKYFPCHCYDNNNSTVGAGCGEINVFESVPESEGGLYGNSNILSTGIRSYQVGSLNGHVCGVDICQPAMFPENADLLDACSKQARTQGAIVTANQNNADCPMWRRPYDDRYFSILLDANTRIIHVGIIHPKNIPATASTILPQFPESIPRSAVDAWLQMQLPTP